MTGGTGFFGQWMLETFLRANTELGLGARATVLTRDPSGFAQRCSHLATQRDVQFVSGDVRSFQLPHESVTHVLHMAGEARSTASPRTSFETSVLGTLHVLALAEARGAERLLFTSSGAVYGRQPMDRHSLAEDYTGAPLTSDAASGYAEGKRGAEFACLEQSSRGIVQAVVARCFSFVGPAMPVAASYAICDFINDGIKGSDIVVCGDGTPRRSYLYASDMATWLWTILVKGESGRVYNVGSPHAVSLRELAGLVADVVSPGASIRVRRQAQTGTIPDRYVPDVGRARRELGLSIGVPLATAIGRTASWMRSMDTS